MWLNLRMTGIVTLAFTIIISYNMYHVRWAATKVRFIERDTRALLHYLRSLRNAGAHPNTPGTRRVTGPREMASVVAEIANALWKSATATRARLTPKVVTKTW
jgi:hypothetical protein